MATRDPQTGRWRDARGRPMQRWRVFGEGRRQPVYAMAATPKAASRACHSAGLGGMNRNAMAVPDDDRLF